MLFSLGSYIGGSGWPQKINSAVWTPLVLLFFFRAMRGQRPLLNSCLSGAFLGLNWLGGHHEIPILLGTAMVGLWFYRLVTGEGSRRQVVRDFVAYATFAFLVGALQILPAVEFGRLGMRWVGAPEPVSWGDIVP